MISDINEVTLFQAIPKEDLDELRPLFKLRHFKKNHNLVFENDLTDEVYFIREGIVKVYRMNESQEIVFNFHFPGDTVGEVEALYYQTDNGRMASIEAIEPVTAWVLSRNDFHYILDKHPMMLKWLYSLLAERLRLMNRKVRSIAFGDTRSRTADLLLDLYYNCGIQEQDSYKINLKLPQSLLADMIGITRESISKILNEFKREGMIDIRDRYLHIFDLKRLEATSNDSEENVKRMWNT